MTRRRLPIGLQTFRELRERDCYYVDKTHYIQRLVDDGKHYFLSRPRRFGKSLFLDTCKELFEGSQALFEGLSVHDAWDWSVRNPVVRLSFASGNLRDADGLRANLMAQLDAVQRRTGIVSDYQTVPERFGHVLEQLHRHSGEPVVVLIDEYDKPILDVLDQPDAARANRDFLQGVYAVIKDHDADIRFTFLTGVSKFSRVSLFSGLNNLNDITLDPRYSAICGYTESDLDAVFGPELEGLDRDEIRDWYNGYGWRGGERVYNPFDILLLFDRREFRSYWFETGTPTFLVRTLLERRVATLALEEMMAGDDLLSRFDVDDIATEALLFQTGYLTITGERNLGGTVLYRLDYPNREVKQSLNAHLLGVLGPDRAQQPARNIRLYELLEASDFAGMEALFRSLFAGIPYEWYTNNDIAHYEGYYASIFYSSFAALGVDVAVEDHTSHGRVDMAVRFGGSAFVFEFKVVEAASPGAAIAQLKEKGYAEKYRASSDAVWLIGIEFSEEARNLASFTVERA